MRFRLAPEWALCLTVTIPILAAAQDGALPAAPQKLSYSAEWRFLHAADAQLVLSGKDSADLHLGTTGLVATFIKVEDHYRAMFGSGWCTASTEMTAHEGKRKRETMVSFDSARRKASYLERDLVGNATVAAQEIDIPACVHDVLGGLQKLRESHPAPGLTVEMAVSDGKKVVMARIEAQGRDTVRTPAGEFSAIRYEAFLMNGVLYRRKGRLFVWISDDEKRLPVQIKLQFPFYVGTVTLRLEKVE